MTHPAPTIEPPDPRRFTVEQYFALVDRGVLGEDDRVELLEGVVVAMPPSGPEHATAVNLVDEVLRKAIGDRAAVRCQTTFIGGRYSASEPDVAVVPGRLRDYARRHPSEALLAVEVADSSLPSDRLSKSRIYAAAGVPEYWIVNLRDRQVEVMRDPAPETAVYGTTLVARPGERLVPVAFPDVSIVVAVLLPDIETPDGVGGT
jgi:Uma2 family endonuclease